MTRTLNAALVALALLAGGGVANAQMKPAPKPGTFAAEERALASPGWMRDFPRLHRWEVLAPSTGDSKVKGSYNCIAHSMRIYHKWVWPQGASVQEFDQLYGSLGYRRTRTLDYRFDPKVEKVVLYATRRSDGSFNCTHGSRQLADGTWTSKLGGGPLIRHPTPDCVGGGLYGEPIYVYVRQRKQPIIRPASARTRVASLDR
jgi:hypothetical protein